MNLDNLKQDLDKPTFKFFTEDENRLRLRELILYIAEQSITDPGFGIVKLNKILYFADVFSYRETGKPITGAPYIKLQYGPVAKPVKSLLDEMKEERDIVIAAQPIFDYEKQRVVACRVANLDMFTGGDIALIDRIIKQHWGKTAVEISEESHGIAWKTAEMFEPIPYEAALLSDVPLTEEEIIDMANLLKSRDRR